LLSAAFFVSQQVSVLSRSDEARIILQSKSRQLKGLRKIDLAILSTQNLEEIIDLAVDQIYDQLEPYALRIYLLNETADQYDLKIDHGTMPPRSTEYFSLNGKWNTLDTQIVQIEGSENISGKPSLYIVTPLVGRHKILGVVEVLIDHKNGILREWVEYFEAVAGQLAIAIDHVHIIEQYEAVNRVMTNTQEQLLKGWAKALEFKDRETKGHTDRVAALTQEMGISMGLSADEIENMTRGAYLHDIGKMAIPDHILFKDGPLSEEEWRLMKKHPLYAQEFLDGIGFLDEAMLIPLYHHERWDGSGYPFGLEGEEIPLSARIFAIVDVWDALTHDRPYRSSWTELESSQYLQRLAGELFDPLLVEKFLVIMKTLVEV
jgi:HD-GYP domain-containing protein (c-di-GMP phosphodiesterase class II)